METAVMKPGNRTPKAPRSKSLGFEDFTPDQNMSESQRAAQFLDWCATKMPMRFVSFAWIAKHAYIKPSRPRFDAPEVDVIRKRKMNQIKRILWQVYGRRTVPSPRGTEPGVRATSDHDDLAGTDLVKSRRRVTNSIRRMADTHSKIDPDQMRDPSLKAMVEGMDGVVRTLMKPELLKRLELPPARKPEPKGDE